ncbi:MAG TPA: helix-turn-helix domain-containing protein [Cellvibrionaceae bacterium]
MTSVTFFLCDEMLASSITLPLEQLSAAADFTHAHHKGKPIPPPFTIRLASLDGKSKRAHSGISLAAHSSIDAIENSDITYLPALWRNPQKLLKQNRALLPWLKQQHHNGNIIAGVGTGCCFMAEAGLLDNQTATTHWHYFDEFALHYPKVKLLRDYFITRAGNLYCTGSVNSTADLTIQFIRQYYSLAAANHVERHFFHEIRNSGLHLGRPQWDQPHRDELIAQAQAWLGEHLESDLHMDQVALHFRLSVRSFNRRFRAATAQTPLHYLHERRILLAKELLKTSNLSISEISLRCGYQDFAHFTKLFKKHLGVTPSEYRTTVRAKLFAVE